MKQKQRFGSLLLVLALLLGLCATAFAAVSDDALNAAVQDTAAYIHKTVTAPQVASVGGEWAVLGLARSGYSVPEKYYQDYYAKVEQYVKERNGVLHEKKYTEYSRVILALSAIGKDARDVAGYDLTAPLGDYDKTIWQGFNGPIWALIALDSADYPMPQGSATRQRYVDLILEKQLPDGGWNLEGKGAADPDMTGMALQALARYQDQAKVKAATDKALDCIGKLQDDKGGFSSWGAVTSESCAQIIAALCELGVSLDDPRFVKNGRTILDNLMSFYKAGNGFQHTLDGSGVNQMATEQAFYALVSLQRVRQGKNSLYRMSDALSIQDAAKPAASQGLPGKDPAVHSVPVKEAKTFPDVAGHKNQAAIEAMAARGIINGKGGSFKPNDGMTRAEFAKIVVESLGLTPKANGKFKDVAANAWYAPAVGTASDYGIINGVSSDRFNPQGSITKQQAARMVWIAAKLCGMDTAMDKAAVQDTLAPFADYRKSADWAQTGLAFCYKNGILDDSELNILPDAPAKRCEVAQMLYNLLDKANLL